MIFQRVNRTDPERVYVIAQNNEGAALNKDQTVQHELTAASIDGVKVRDMDTANLWAFVGIADAAINDGEYGLIQVYGYRSTSIVFQTNTSQTTGLPMIPVAAVDYVQSAASTMASNTTATVQPFFVLLGESVASSSASATISKKVFIRAL